MNVNAVTIPMIIAVHEEKDFRDGDVDDDSLVLEVLVDGSISFLDEATAPAPATV